MGQAEFDAFVQAQRAVRKLAVRDVRAWWATLPDTSDIRAVARAADEVLLAVSVAHGETSATLAADYYDLARNEAGAPGRFTARMAEPPDRSLVESLRFKALGPLLGGNPDPAQALSNLEAAADVLSLKQGRDTLMLNSATDPAEPMFARVPVGKTCAWCLMLASRGAVYTSAESAGEGAWYHNDCDCEPHPSWSGNGLPEDYDEGALYETYDNAAAAVKADGKLVNDSTVAAKMRELYGLA